MADLQKLELARRAEIGKLAAVLGVEPESLAELGSSAGADELHRLRRRINKTIFDEKRDRFIRLERVTRLLPASYVARLATEAFGPLLSARVVAEMNPLRARNIARHVSAAFVADVAPHIDPEKVQELIPQLPTELVKDTALLLVEREDYVTMGRFGDALSAQQLRAVVSAIDDDAALLLTGFFIEKREQLSRIIHNIDNVRIARIMRRGTEANLLPQALFIIDHVTDELKGRLADIMGEQDEATLDKLVSVADEELLWGPILRGLSNMHPRYRRKIVNLPQVKNEQLLGDLVRAAYEEGLLAVALPLARVMRPDYKRVVAHAALKQGADVAEAALEAAHSAGEWSTLLDLARYADESERELLATLRVLRRPEAMEALLEALNSDAAADMLLDVLGRMDQEAQQTAAYLLAAEGGALLEHLLDLAGGLHERWGTVARIIARLDGQAMEDAGRVLRRRSDAEAAALRDGAKREKVWDVLAPQLEQQAA